MARETRRSERVAAQVAVRLERGAAGVTRDLSPNGVFFIVNEEANVGETIRFSVEFANLGSALLLKCVGEIVRIEEGVGGKRGFAVKIVESRLERQEPPFPRRAKDVASQAAAAS